MLFKGICTLFLLVLLTGCKAPINRTKEIDQVEPQSLTPDAPANEPDGSGTDSALPPIAACPLPLGAPTLPELMTPANWANDLLAYLNQGGSLSVLSDHLSALTQVIGETAVIADLNADGFHDLVVNLEEPPSSAGRVQHERSVMVFLCDRDSYRLVYASNIGTGADQIQISHVQDMTGDGVPEILWMAETCGAHTCFQVWEVLQWQSNQFANVLTGKCDDLPSPQIQLSGPKDDGSMIMTLTGSGVLSAGAGPSRPLSRIWHWSASEAAFLIVEERLAIPYFRIHALHDADQAASANQFELALDGYQQVIEDPELDDYPYGEEGFVRLSAYALYRSVLIMIEQGELTQAEDTKTFLFEAHPPGSPGEGYSALAEVVWQAYQTQFDLGLACEVARAYALEHPQQVLEPLSYGYANKAYTAVDICPIDPS